MQTPSVIGSTGMPMMDESVMVDGKIVHGAETIFHTLPEQISPDLHLEEKRSSALVKLIAGVPSSCSASPALGCLSLAVEAASYSAVSLSPSKQQAHRSILGLMASRTSSTRSGMNSNVVEHEMICKNCGRRRKTYTSWTNDNPGRRFLQCPRRDCNHFTWIDDPLCERCAPMIRSLIRRIRVLETQSRSRNTSDDIPAVVAERTGMVADSNVPSLHMEPVRHHLYSWVSMICTWVGVVFILVVFKTVAR
ncbi:hypothetical protein Dimus_033103 [Dionaea muscipula]